MKTKYKIVKSEGCMSYGTTVNDQNIYGEYEPMSQQQIETFVDYLCQKFKEKLKVNTVSIDDLIECFQYESCETENDSCETCGDSVTTTTWNL
jgi:hypothetical protein